MLRVVDAKVKNFTKKPIKEASSMCLKCGAILEKESTECPTCRKQSQNS